MSGRGSSGIDAWRCMRLNERRQAMAFELFGTERERLRSGVMAYAPEVHWICKAVGLDLDAPLGDDDVARVVAFYRSRDVPPVLELTTHSDEATFAAAARAGFTLVEAENALARVPTAVPVEVPSGLAIVDLDREDEAAMRRHAEIVCSGFPPPDGRIAEPMIAAAIASQHQPTARGFFVVDEQGEPVAASGMEVTEVDPGDGGAPVRVTALWGTTVLPAHRRRGIQQALIAHRLRVGREAGSELAVIESKPGIPTERNAARLGFALAYTRLVLRG